MGKPAPIGNKYAVGNNGGREKMYTSREDVISVVEDYFKVCDRQKINYTITGLAIHMDFASRQTLYEYRDSTEFGDIIRKAIIRVENRYECGLDSQSVTGSIFALKNMGWADRSEVHNTGEQTNNINIESLPDEVIAAIVKGIKDTGK